MAKRESFLIRLDPRVLNSIRKWADDEMRSANGQIEYLLRQCAIQAGRLGETETVPGVPSSADDANSKAPLNSQQDTQGQDRTAEHSDTPPDSSEE
ncbi:MAG: hypothetical protein AB8B50_09175 [Pirellulaceae bacterium]